MIKKTMICVVALIFSLTATGQTAADIQGWKKRVDPVLAHVKEQSDWLLSRLQMYWATHATDVIDDGEYFDSPAGNRAPVATVKLNGARNHASAYKAPALEDVVPYDDDAEGNVHLFNPQTNRMEKVHPSKTGGNINSMNRRVLDVARDAARLFTATHDTAYASLAFGVFDTYMKGIYHRNVPRDKSNGHIATLVGMQTFEVIHEDVVTNLTEIYQRLKGVYIRRNSALYESAFKKWAEVIIDNGVPHNNWDLFQAEFIAQIAEVLQPNEQYKDGKGQGYYLNYILNESSIRQWSLTKLADYGYDAHTGIWSESPGYSLTVLNEFCSFANHLDQRFGIDLFTRIPVLRKALFASPQYLFPNRMFAGFGDTHPTFMNKEAGQHVLAYAQRHGNVALADSVRSLLAAIDPAASTAEVQRYVSPMFYAPNVSWLVQRTGMHPQHDLMVSLNASLGNHQHANGISMELYGKGYVQGPDGGIGKALYGGDDYKEYYSQFPAHNTVCVDGISSYPVMLSSHAFTVDDRFPVDNADSCFVPATYSQLSFLEPESNAQQVRTTGIVKTSAKGGYYVDIFRSKKVMGGDKMHDYFYHNLGQRMLLTDKRNRLLTLHPTDQMAFAGGHLYAYSYIYDAQCTAADTDLKATFITNDSLRMTMWMARSPHRDVFKALSPANLEYERMPHQPYDIGNQPVLTFVARQRGEAWNHPFVAIYEPSSVSEPSEIATVDFFKPKSKDPSAVGIAVHLKNGETDYIFSSVQGSDMRYNGMKVSGHYAVVSPRFTLKNNTLKTNALNGSLSKQ